MSDTDRSEAIDRYAVAGIIGVILGFLIAALLLSSCYIERRESSCPQYDPATQQWVDRCKQ